jgi:insulysin
VLEHHLLQYFAVQSNSHHPGELLARFELFLEDFVRSIDEVIPEERFESIRSTLLQEFISPPLSFSLAAQGLYQLAFEEKGDFTLVEKKIGALQDLRYEDLKFHAAEMLSRKNSRRIAVVIEGKIPKDNEFRYRKVEPNELKQMGMLVFDE